MPRPQAAHALDVQLPLDLQHLSPHQPGEAHPGGEHQGQQDALGARLQHAHQGDHEHHAGQALKDVGDAGDHHVHRAAAVAGGHPHRQPHRHGAAGGRHRQQQGGPAAVDHPAEHVPAQGVGAQGVGRAGVGQAVGHVDLEGVIGGQPGGEDGHQHDGQQDTPHNGQLEVLFLAQRHASPPCTRIFGLTKM